MLASIRNKSTGWVAYLIVGLITVPFALFGINQYFQGQQNIIVISVDGDNINKNTYLQSFNQRKRELQEQLGDDYNQSIDNTLKQNAVTQLINNKLLEQFASDLNIATTNQEIKQRIITDQNFFKDGKFNLENYNNLLRVNGYTPAQYEQLIAEQINNLQIKNNLLNSEFLTKFEEEQINYLLNQERKIAYVVIKNADFEKKIKITDKEVSQFFNANKTNFNNPKKVKIDFVELDVVVLAKNLTIKPEDLQTFYESEKDRWITDEQRRVSHILLEDKVQAEKILTQLNQGGDFTALAKKYSKDTGSAKLGGDLGFFTKGVMVPEFEKQVFAMQKNETSELVKTEFGYHIIKLIEIKPVALKEFSEVEEQTTQEYRDSQAQKQFFELSEKMSTIAYEGSLEDIAEELNLKLKTTDFLTVDSTEYDKKMITASFSNETLEKNENSVVELSDNKILALRKNTFIDATPKTLAQAKTEITNQLFKQKAKVISEAKIKQIINQKSDAWNKTKWVTRADKETPIEVLDFVFTIAKPKTGATIDYKVLSDQSIAVKIDEVRAGTKESALNPVITSYNNELFANILNYLRQRAEIKVYRDRL